MPANSHIQFGFAFINPKTGKQVKNPLRQAQAIMRFAESEGREELPSVHLIARWRNPDDKHDRSRQWKTTDDPGQTLEDFYATLEEGRGLLSAVGVFEKARLEILNEKARRSHLKGTGPVSRKRQTGKPEGTRTKVPKVAGGKSPGKRRNVQHSGLGKRKTPKSKKRS